MQDDVDYRYWRRRLSDIAFARFLIDRALARELCTRGAKGFAVRELIVARNALFDALAMG